MKKIINLFLFILLIPFEAHTQSFYQIKWTGHDKINYWGLLVYYSQDDAFVRVKYRNNDSAYIVAEYKCKCKYYNTDDGKQHFYINGENAHVVFPANSQKQYNADNFIFTNVNANGDFEKFYTIDDSQLEKDNYSDYFKEATFTKLTPPFTEQFLYNYFDRNESAYSQYLAIGRKQTGTSVNNDATKMYVIIVANTLDESIGRGCKVDMNKLSVEFSNIAEALGVQIVKTIIAGKNFTKENVMAAITNIHPESNDVVLFFYRGHGYRWSNQDDDWPQMSLRYSPYQPLTCLGLYDAYKMITNKGARLNVVIGDLCNTDIGLSYPTNYASNSLQSSFYPDMNKLRKLFLHARGNIISAAAKKNEVSWVNSYDGGLYTSSFFESFHQEVSNTSGSGDWANLIDATINKALYKSTSCKSSQHGIRIINVNYSH